MYIQDIEIIHESTTKGKYSLITTKTDYKKATIEAKDMLKYVYQTRKSNDSNYSSPLNDISTIHINVSTYAQALMQFHESNTVPGTSSHKILKLQFNKKSNSTNKNSTTDIPQTIHNKTETKSVTSVSSRSRGKTKSVTFDDEEELVTLFQKCLQAFGTPPQVIYLTYPQQFSMGIPSSLQQSNGGRGREIYAQYEGGRGRGRFQGRGLYQPEEYSDYRDKAQSTATLETQEDITFVTDSEKIENWKDQVSDMMKDLRTSIMIDVKDLIEENMKQNNEKNGCQHKK